MKKKLTREEAEKLIKERATPENLAHFNKITDDIFNEIKEICIKHVTIDPRNMSPCLNAVFEIIMMLLDVQQKTMGAHIPIYIFNNKVNGMIDGLETYLKEEN